MIGFVSALAALAVAAAIVIHTLNRGVRHKLVVANPALYADAARPRLTLLRVTQRALLYARLALLLVAAAIAVQVNDTPPSAASSTAISVAVVPGTELANVAPELVSATRGVWLDAALTPLSSAAVSTLDMRALRQLDTQLPAGRALTVVGNLPAREWPRHGFAMSRDVEWIPIAGRTPQDASASTIDPVVVIAAPPAWHSALRAVAKVWLRADLVSDVRIVAPSDADATDDEWLLLTAGVDAVPPRAATAVTAAVAYEALDSRLNDTELASVLWRAIAGRVMDVPTASALVAGAAFTRVPYVASPHKRRDPALPWGWVWCLIALLALERVLAVRARRPA